MSRDHESDKSDEVEEPSPEPEAPLGIGAFLMEHKAWWLGPIIVVVVLLLALMVLSATQTVPFMYRMVRGAPAGEHGPFDRRGPGAPLA